MDFIYLNLWQLLFIMLILFGLLFKFIYHGRGKLRDTFITIFGIVMIIIILIIFWKIGIIAGAFSLIMFLIIFYYILDRIIWYIYQKVIYSKSPTLNYYYFLWRTMARDNNKELRNIIDSYDLEELKKLDDNFIAETKKTAKIITKKLLERINKQYDSSGLPKKEKRILKELENIIITIYIHSGSKNIAINVLFEENVLQNYIELKYFNENTITNKELALEILEQIGFYDY